MPSKQQNKNLLFVYGSLKRGFNNHQLLKNATFIAEAKTLQPYSMFVETHGQYPYLLKNRPFHHSRVFSLKTPSNKNWNTVQNLIII